MGNIDYGKKMGIIWSMETIVIIDAWTSRFNKLRSKFQSIIEYTQGVSSGLTVSHLPCGNECLVEVWEGKIMNKQTFYSLYCI